MPMLTDVMVRNARAPAPDVNGRIVQQDVWDEAIPGFGLRLSSTGKKSWILGARFLKAGRRVFSRIVLGSYPAMTLSEARENARHAKLLASQNKDPRELIQKEKAARVDESRNTFSVVADEFLSKYVERKGLRPTTKRDYRHTLKGRDVAGWSDRPITSIAKRDILDAMDRIVARGSPVAANHLLAYLRKFFDWCAERGIIQEVPTERLKPPAKVAKRDRVLSAEEIKEVWTAMSALETSDEPKQRGDVFGRLFKILMLTGQRREEVADMRWDELHGLEGHQATWELPGERTKNGRPHVVPLAPQAVAILRTVPRIGRSAHVFTTDGKVHVSGFSKAKLRLDAAIAKHRKKQRIPKPMAAFVVHDLRRTVSTRMHEDLGIAPHIVEVVLNHISGFRAGVAGTYNRALYLEEKRRALEQWAGYVDSLVAATRKGQGNDGGSGPA